MPKRVYLVDLDGTVSDDGHRQHLTPQDPEDPDAAWDDYHKECHLDPPIPYMLEIITVLGRSNHLLFVTGRTMLSLDKTEKWLKQYGLYEGNRLFMRSASDFRPNPIVKSEIVDRILAEGYEIIAAFDDRPDVVKMYRDRGIPCLHVTR